MLKDSKTNTFYWPEQSMELGHFKCSVWSTTLVPGAIDKTGPHGGGKINLEMNIWSQFLSACYFNRNSYSNQREDELTDCNDDISKNPSLSSSGIGLLPNPIYFPPSLG